MVISLSLEKLASFVVSPAFTLLWGGIILSYGFAWVTALLHAKGRVHAEILESTRVVKQTRDGRAFAHGFIDVSARIMILPRVRMAWKEFSSSLVHPSSQGEGERYALRSCRAPMDFFNEETLINPSLDPPTYQKTAAHLSAMGILGTFCGLAAGVYLARDGLSGGDLKQLLFSLSSMLKGASLGFSTSILGIVSGILFSHFERSVTRALFIPIEALNQALLFRIELTSYEKIMAEQAQIGTTQGQLLSILIEEIKKFNTGCLPLKEEALVHFTQDIRAALVETITIMNKEVKRSVVELTDLIRKEELAFAAVLEKPLLSALEKIENINKAMQQQWKDYHTRFAEVDESLNLAFTNTNESIISFSNKFKDLTKSFDQHLSKGIHSLSGAIGDLHAVVKDISPACEKIASTFGEASALNDGKKVLMKKRENNGLQRVIDV